MSKTKKTVEIATLKKSFEASEYQQTLSDIKKHIRQAQIRAVHAANKELIKLYWFIGHTISERQRKSEWGSSVIERLAQDLQNEFPGIAGFSRANVFHMRSFYLAYEKVQQAARQIEELPIFAIPWWHNVVLLTKLKDTDERLWYAQQAVKNGWSRNVLELNLESDLYHREGKAITNFKKTLAKPQSYMAQQSLKDPYLFDFLTLHEAYVEKDVEQGLINHIQKFLLELGQGFAFVGRQVHLHVGQVDYYIDLLFYHYKLRCFIVVELKVGKFDPRDVGQINFYLSAIDDVMRSADDKPTIGLLLCRTKDNITAEYALRNISSPIGVAEYTTKLVEKLPKELKGNLPSIADIEEEIGRKESGKISKKDKRTK